MPFSQTNNSHNEDYWNKIYRSIKTIIESLNFDCKKSEVGPYSVIKNVINSIHKSDIVIAVLTDFNPNVWYELGIRHSLKNGTLMLLEKGQIIPFNISAYGVIRYDDDVSFSETLGDEIEKYLFKLRRKETIDSPVIDVIGIPQYLNISNQLQKTNKKIFNDIAYTEQIEAKEIENIEKEKHINKKEIKELNKIEMQTKSPVSKKWANALTYFLSSEYEQALDIFKSLMENKKIIPFGEVSDMNYFIGYIYYKKGDYIESNNYYEEAIKYDSDYKRNAFNMKGINFVLMAKKESDEEKQIILYNNAIDMYKEAAKIDSSKYHAFYNWGYALMVLAKLTNKIDKKRNLYKEAYNKNEKVIFINPHFLFAHDRMGCCLGYLSQLTSENSEKENLFDRGFDKVRLSAKAGGRCYNYACFLSLKKEKDEALIWLENSLKRKDVDFDWIDNDEDWNNYRNDKEFNQLRLNYAQKPIH